jgi:ribosomal protein S24E
MKMDVTEEKKNTFFKRTDLMFTLDHTGQPTPKVEDVKKEITEKFKTTPDKVEIIYILTHAGDAKSRVKSRIWEEGVPVKKVKERKEKPKAEEKPKDEVKEKPKDEQKLPEKKEGEKK